MTGDSGGQPYDALVIGGGVNALASLYHLLRPAHGKAAGGAGDGGENNGGRVRNHAQRVRSRVTQRVGVEKGDLTAALTYPWSSP